MYVYEFVLISIRYKYTFTNIIQNDDMKGRVIGIEQKGGMSTDAIYKSKRTSWD